MANWHQTIDLRDEFKKFEESEITVQILAQAVSDKLKALPPYTRKDFNYEEEKTDILEEFKNLAECKETTIDEFDSLMQELYDWADGDYGNQKVCWINT